MSEQPSPVQRPESARQAWSRLVRMGGPRPTRGNLLVAVMAALLGFAVSTQIHQTRDQGLETLRQSELVSILDTVSQRANRLTEEANSLTRTRDDLLNGQSGSRAAIETAQRRVAAMEVLVGSVPVSGPGITVTINDPQRKLGFSTLLDAVQELRDAGAEAIQVGNVRVVATTAFTEPSEGHLVVGGVPTDPPYTILAIGDAQTLSGAMNIPGGVVESVRQHGATISVASPPTVTIGALHVSEKPRYAQPVPAAAAPSAP